MGSIPFLFQTARPYVGRHHGVDPRVKPEDDRSGTGKASSFNTNKVIPWLDHGIHTLPYPNRTTRRRAPSGYALPGQAG